MGNMGQTLRHLALKQIAYDMWAEEIPESAETTSAAHLQANTAGTLTIFQSIINLACVAGLQIKARDKTKIKE